MTLQQLRILREIERHALNISAAAKALNTSQPGLSRQLQALERELGVALLLRKKNRVVGLSSAGKQVLSQAKQILGRADEIETIARTARGGQARLAVATTHLHARYTLLQPFKTLQEKHPNLRLFLFQAHPDDIPRLVAEYEADVGVDTSDDGKLPPSGLRFIAGGPLERTLLVPRDHPLSIRRKLTIADLGKYPHVGYHPRTRTGAAIAEAFAAHGVVQDVVVQANDSDVIQAYVAGGFGIGIVPSIILAGPPIPDVVAIDVTPLFKPAHTNIVVRNDMHLRGYMLDFVRMIAPEMRRRLSPA